MRATSGDWPSTSARASDERAGTASGAASSSTRASSGYRKSVGSTPNNERIPSFIVNDASLCRLELTSDGFFKIFQVLLGNFKTYICFINAVGLMTVLLNL